MILEILEYHRNKLDSRKLNVEINFVEKTQPFN